MPLYFDKVNKGFTFQFHYNEYDKNLLIPIATRSLWSIINASTLTVTGTNACTAEAWSFTQIYNGNELVAYNGNEWKAKWWTQGNAPGTGGEWGPWEDQGPCNSMKGGSIAPNQVSLEKSMVVYPNLFKHVLTLEYSGEEGTI